MNVQRPFSPVPNVVARPRGRFVSVVRLARVVAVVLLASVLPLRGDDVPTAPQPPTEKPAAGTAGRIAGDVVFLPDAEGRLVPVPKGATLEEYLEYLRQRKAVAESEHSVVRIDLKGTTDDKLAEFDATIRVQVNGDGWVRVPLSLNDAVLRDFGHRFEAPAAVRPNGSEDSESAGETEPPVGDANFDGRDDDEGYVWRLRGRGVHELSLKMLVPVRLQSPTRRLQLDLPETAVSSLELEVAEQPIAVTPPRDAQWNVSTRGGTKSLVTMFGLGRRLDLSWEPRPRTKKSETSLQAITLVDVRPNDRTVVLEATQQIQVVRGSVASLRLRLPSEFEVRDLTARLLDEPGSESVRLELPTAKDGISEIALPSTLGERGRVELEWTLESAVPWTDGTVVVDGFGVESAASQSGEVAVDGLTGHDVVVRSTQNVHRIDVSELGRPTPSISAFRFLRQPFEIRLDVSEIEPHYTVQPRFELAVDRDGVQLDGEMVVRVYRGALRELVVEWPDFDAEGWVLSPPNVPGLVEQFEVTGTGPESRVRFALLDAATGELTLPIRARRTLGDAETTPFTLPTMPAPYRLPTSLQLTRAIDVEPSLAALAKTSVRRESVPAGPTAAGTVFVETLRVEPGPHAFELSVEPRERTIVVEGELRPELEGDVLHVRERLEYDVRYGRVEFVELETSGDLPVVVLDGARTITPEWTEGGEPDGPRVARVALGEPRSGRFSLTVVRKPLDAGEVVEDESSLSLQFDVVTPANVDGWSTRLLSDPADGVDVEPVGGEWEAVANTSAVRRWTSASPTRRTTLRVRRSDESPGVLVRKALARTVFDAAGGSRTWARFEVERVSRRLVVQLPEGTVADRFSWNGRELRRDEVVAPRNGSPRYTLTVGSSDEGLLLVRSHTLPSPTRVLSGVLAGAPELVGARSAEETVWELAFPADRYLLVPPADMTPGYRWQRAPLFWKRVPETTFADPVSWIDDQEDEEERAAFEGRNSYVFSRVGPVAELEVRVAGRAYVVLFGAGLSLAMGFVLLKIPALRSVLVVLAVGFVLAVLSLWFPEPVMLLLQPALLGLLLALAAAFIDGLFVRRQSSPVLSFPSPLDASASGSGRGSSVVVGDLSDVHDETGLYVQPISSQRGAPS